MTTKINNDDLMTEELNTAKNQIEKQMILQKYGIIEPKLTPQEKAIIKAEWINEWKETDFIFTPPPDLIFIGSIGDKQ